MTILRFGGKLEAGFNTRIQATAGQQDRLVSPRELEIKLKLF
jgi:hypothetical protein